jgi:hypothetical protein
MTSKHSVRSPAAAPPKRDQSPNIVGPTYEATLESKGIHAKIWEKGARNHQLTTK